MASPNSVLDANVPIPVLEPFRAVNRALLDLLPTLTRNEWHSPTVHSDRNVKDLVAHLVHGSLRRVTALRDRYHAPSARLSTHEELTAFIQADNRLFMDGMRRVSPEILMELTERYDAELLPLLEALDPAADGLGVVWAGEWNSKNWFDVAREYTEKWHHQQQIRDATRRPPLYESALLAPVLETFARGLPYAFRMVECPEGATVVVQVTGQVSLCWLLHREGSRWVLQRGVEGGRADATVSVPADTAWRVWTKGLPPAAAQDQSEVSGDSRLAATVFNFVAIMA